MFLRNVIDIPFKNPILLFRGSLLWVRNYTPCFRVELSEAFKKETQLLLAKRRFFRNDRAHPLTTSYTKPQEFHRFQLGTIHVRQKPGKCNEIYLKKKGTENKKIGVDALSTSSHLSKTTGRERKKWKRKGQK